MSSRDSSMTDYNPHNSTILYEDRHIIRVRRSDGTRAFGAKDEQGMLTLAQCSIDPEFKDWKVWSLPGGDIYLMEEVNV